LLLAARGLVPHKYLKVRAPVCDMFEKIRNVSTYDVMCDVASSLENAPLLDPGTGMRRR
jgi:hypothetical protein